MNTGFSDIAAKGDCVVRRLGSIDVAVAVAATVVALLVLMVVVGPALAPYNPNAVDPLAVYAGPSSEHWLGTDSVGRDIFSRLLVGARASLVGPAVVVSVAGVLAAVLAFTAAWFGGWVDTVISRSLDIQFAFPGLLLAIIAVALFGPGQVAPIVALSIAYTPYMARVVRSVARKERQLPYIETAWVQGLPVWRIWLKHLGPNLLPFMVAQVSVAFGYVLLDLAAISYLGLGVQPPAAEWGLMVSNGQPDIVGGHPAESLYAACTILIAVVSFNVLGQRLSGRLLRSRG